MAKLLTIGLALALCLLAAPVYAQPEEQPAAGRFHAGPSVTFTPAVVLVGGADSNLGRSTDSAGGTEFYTVPQVEGWVGRGRVRVNFGAAIEYGRQSTVGSQFNQVARAQVDAGNRRTQFRALGSHGNIYAPPSDFVGFELGIRSRRVQDVLESSFRLRPGGRMSYGVLARRSRLRYDADARFQGASLEQNLNRNGTALEAEVGVTITRLSSAVFRATRTTDQFLFARSRDGDGYSLVSGLQFNERALISGRALGGVLHYTTRQTQTTFGGPMYILGLTADHAPFFIDVSGTRYIDFSFDPDRGFYISSGLDVYSALRAKSGWEVFGRASWRRLEPKGPRSGSEIARNVQVYKAGLVRHLRSESLVGVEFERNIYGGNAGFNARRVIAFLTYGSSRLQRLDRPLPGEF